MEKSDQDIVLEYLQGNEEVFALLVERHTRSVYSLAYSLTASRLDAEDIAAETFLKAWKNIKKYRAEYAFKTWLLTIARNTAFDFLRKKKNFVFSDFENNEGENYLVDSLVDTDTSAIEKFAIHEDGKRVRDVLQTLPALYREILDLRYGEELTFEEIATILQKPMNTVKSQSRRAIALLKKKLGINAPN